MNINTEKKENLTSIITIDVVENDYKEAVEKELKKQRAKAVIKGFRKGQAPIALIKKMMGNNILSQEVLKVAYDALGNYLSKDFKNQVGDPILTEDSSFDISYESGKDFKFCFEVGQHSDFEVNLTQDIVIESYNIKPDEKELETEIQTILSTYGGLDKVDEIAEKSYIKATLLQSSEDNVIDTEGLKKENAMMAIDIIKDEDIKKSFIGKKLNDTLTIDLKKAYPNDTELSSLLNIEKEKVAELNPFFEVTITEITEFKPAEMGQELFDKVFGKDAVKTEEEFKAKVQEKIDQNHKMQSDAKVSADLKEKLLEICDIQLPDDFLKRLIKTKDAEKKEFDDEKLEKLYPDFSKDFKWTLISRRLAEKEKIEVTEEEVKREATNLAIQRFAQYGIPINQVPADTLEKMTDEFISNKEYNQQIRETIMQVKVFEEAKKQIKLEPKEITLADFMKL